MDECVSEGKPSVNFIFKWQEGRVVDITTNSAPVNHFLELLRLSRAYNTWVSYGQDLKVFFRVIQKQPEEVTRGDCLVFMREQDQSGFTDATINRRLAAVSSLFNELSLLDPSQFRSNPVQPAQRGRYRLRPSRQSLYRRQPQRIPNIVPTDELQTFLGVLPSWRDRSVVMLMWMSCLRISEVLNIRFQDIECSHRRIWIAEAKYGNARNVFMDRFTFASLNQYLDEERGNLFSQVEQIFVAFKGKARGRPLTINTTQKMLRYYAEKCGLPHIHAHLFRHTGISQLVQQGMPEPAIRQMVGHQRSESLLPYLHLSDEFVESGFKQAQNGFDLSNWFGDIRLGGES
ncbi:MAG: tyrosine-type recombinase/integrase [Caldilineaceae bacterium]|jgi:site-specific recombinase XerD|nr:tyrosine-type recombinase/integrase [Caldilineaceae bacterium]